MYGSGFMHTVCGDAKVPVDVVPVDVVAERLLYATFAEAVDREAGVIHATVGREHSPTIGEIYDLAQVFFAPRHRQTYFKPYCRVFGDRDDPRIGPSNDQDVAALLRLQKLLEILGQGKKAKLLGRAADGLRRIPRIFQVFTHTPYHFTSKIPLKDHVPDFDKSAYLKLAFAGVYHHLLGGRELPVVAANFIPPSRRSRTSRHLVSVREVAPKVISADASLNDRSTSSSRKHSNLGWKSLNITTKQVEFAAEIAERSMSVRP